LFEQLEQRMVLSASNPFEGIIDMQASDLHTDASGHEVHALTQLPNLAADPGTGETSAVAAAALAPLGETFLLHSNPGAEHTIFLDFDGHVTSGTNWNSVYNGGQDIVTPAFDFDGNVAAFSDAELQRIQYIWQRVAEDFMPFDVNVTTEDPGSAALTKSGGGDAEWGVRVVVGGSSSDWFGSSAGGVAYVGSFNWSSDTPTFVFEAQLANGNEKYTAEAISHEAGHTLGLRHDGSSSVSYYQGHGDGETGWAPLMGVGYYENLSQWSKGEYSGANNSEDDLAIISGNNGFGYRADDHGDTNGAASSLLVLGNTVNDSGIIETNDDIDVFTFSTESGDVTLNLTPAERGANLDILAQLYDASFALVAAANPTNLLSASMTATLSAGQYFLQVSGTGMGDPLSTGYSDYGSLGQYFVSGTIVPVDYDSLSISATDASKSEGDSGTTAFTFTVNRSGNVDGATTVDYTVAGSGVAAADAADFGGVLPGGTLAFAAGETSKTITLQIAGDVDIEENESFTVSLSNASGQTRISSGSADGSIVNDDVPVAAGIVVTPTSGLSTKETGTSASFTVHLNSRPTDSVTISVQSSDTTEGAVNKSSLTFTPENWNTDQTVTVTGVDDTVRDGHVTYTVQLGAATSADTDYTGLDADDVQVTNQDNEKGKVVGDGGGGGGGGGKGGGGKGKKAPVVAAAFADTRFMSAWTDAVEVDSNQSSADGLARAASAPELAAAVSQILRTNVADGSVNHRSAGVQIARRHAATESAAQLEGTLRLENWSAGFDGVFTELGTDF
jgi:hypothetical protein